MNITFILNVIIIVCLLKMRNDMCSIGLDLNYIIYVDVLVMQEYSMMNDQLRMLLLGRKCLRLVF